MKCPNCNAENENNSKFCTSCGSPIPQPTAQGSSYEGAQYPPRAQGVKIAIGVIVAAIVIAVVVLLIVLFGGKKEETTKPMVYYTDSRLFVVQSLGSNEEKKFKEKKNKRYPSYR